MPLEILHNLLNVYVQLANTRGFKQQQKNIKDAVVWEATRYTRHTQKTTILIFTLVKTTNPILSLSLSLSVSCQSVNYCKEAAPVSEYFTFTSII
jgi:hypothetical protein